MSDFKIPEDLSAWVEASLASRENILATSNQGTLLLYSGEGQQAVIKTTMGRGAVRKARIATLKREFDAYRRLGNVTGVPDCYGFVDEKYLVLEHISGTEFRHADFADREAWFASLLRIIKSCHANGVTHGDLKSKSNILMTADGQPCIIDFGTTVIRREGFRPINRLMFNYLKQLDLNAWVKHKYHGRYEDASEADRQLLNYGLIERVLRRYRKWRDR